MEIFSVTPLNLVAFPEGWIQYPMNNFADLRLFGPRSQGGIPIAYTGAPCTTSVVNFGLTTTDAWGIGCAWASPVIQAQVGPGGSWVEIPNYQAVVQPGS